MLEICLLEATTSNTQYYYRQNFASVLSRLSCSFDGEGEGFRERKEQGERRVLGEINFKLLVVEEKMTKGDLICGVDLNSPLNIFMKSLVL